MLGHKERSPRALTGKRGSPRDPFNNVILLHSTIPFNYPSGDSR